MRRLIIFFILLIPVSLFAQSNSLNFVKESNNTYVAEVKSGVGSIQDAYNLFLKYAENKVKTDNNLIPFARIQLKRGTYDAVVLNDSIYRLIESDGNSVTITGKTVDNAYIDSEEESACKNDNKCSTITELTITKKGSGYKYLLKYIK